MKVHDSMIRFALASGICLLLGGVGASSYWAEKGRADVTTACFAGGGKSLTHGWFGNIYCNK